MKRILLAGFIIGFLLNLLGWVGNAFIFKVFWTEAYQEIHLVEDRVFTGISKEIISLIPDYIYGYLWVWVYLVFAEKFGKNLKTAIMTGLIMFTGGIFTTYLGIVNSGLIPMKISLITTFWALITFLPVAYFLYRLMNVKGMELR